MKKNMILTFDLLDIDLKEFLRDTKEPLSMGIAKVSLSETSKIRK